MTVVHDYNSDSEIHACPPAKRLKLQIPDPGFRDQPSDTVGIFTRFHHHNNLNMSMHGLGVSAKCDATFLRADSCTSAMTIETPDQILPEAEAEESTIRCVCGYGKGADDDDAIMCDRCGTWQHSVCYFNDQDLPPDDVAYLCVDCQPRRIDRAAARHRMQEKLRKLAVLADRILELTCEVMMRDHELDVLDSQRVELEFDIAVMGPMLEMHEHAGAQAILDGWHGELDVILMGITQTMDRRDGTCHRITELEDDRARVKRNEPTRREEDRIRWGADASLPVLYTPSASLGRLPAIAESMPPILLKLIGKAAMKRKGTKRKQQAVGDPAALGGANLRK